MSAAQTLWIAYGFDPAMDGVKGFAAIWAYDTTMIAAILTSNFAVAPLCGMVYRMAFWAE